jgi:hypothetical protein
VINEELKIGVALEFNQKRLLYFMEWKSIASGDYAISLEPSKSSVYGRSHHEVEGTLHIIEIRVVILDDKGEVNEFF